MDNVAQTPYTIDRFYTAAISLGELKKSAEDRGYIFVNGIKCARKNRTNMTIMVFNLFLDCFTPFYRECMLKVNTRIEEICMKKNKYGKYRLGTTMCKYRQELNWLLDLYFPEAYKRKHLDPRRTCKYSSKQQTTLTYKEYLQWLQNWKTWMGEFKEGALENAKASWAIKRSRAYHALDQWHIAE